MIGSKQHPTFLNFDKPYPNHTFVVVIWGSDGAKSPATLECYYKGKRVCAAGKVESYQGKPEIVARMASQLLISRWIDRVSSARVNETSLNLNDLGMLWWVTP